MQIKVAFLSHNNANTLGRTLFLLPVVEKI